MSGDTSEGKSPLHTAAANGNLETVKLLAENHADIDIKGGSWDLTPLQYAVKNEKLEVAKFLIEKGADINAIDPNDHYARSRGGTLLHWAARCWGSQEKMIKFLVENGADINAAAYDGRTPLCLLVKHSGSLDLIRYMIEKGATLNNNRGGTPLYWAYYMDFGGAHPEVANFLIDMGTDVNGYLDDYGDTRSLMRAPLHLAKNLSTVKLLIEKGADVNIKDKKGDTPLHHVRNLPIAKFLVEKGAHVNAVNNIGSTPLHCTENFYIAKFLIQKGADVSASNNEDYTPLHLARNVSIAKLLMENGADFKAATKDGKIILHTAAETDMFLGVEYVGIPDLVEFFIQKGIDVNVTDNHGNTPLHFCAMSKNALAASKLVEKGANVNAVNNDNKTPADYDYESGYTIQSPDKLFTAINDENLNKIRQIVALCKLVNVKDDSELTPLHYVAQKNNKELIQFFLGGKQTIWRKNDTKSMLEKIDVNARSRDHWTPLHFAAQRNNIYNVKLLLESGAAYDAQTIQGQTPTELTENNEIKHLFALVKELFEAVKAGNLEQVTDCITEYKCVIHAVESDGSSPLHWAINKEYKDIIRFLLIKHVNAAQTNYEGSTALHLAVSKSDESLVHCLLEHMKKSRLNNFINAETMSGMTALHIAANKGSLEIVRYLLQYGAIYEIKNRESKRPIDLSTSPDVSNFLKFVQELFEDAENDNFDIVDKLRNIEVDTFKAVINVCNNHGHTLAEVIKVNENIPLLEKISEVKGINLIKALAKERELLLHNPKSSLLDIDLQEESEDLDLGFGLFD